MTPRRGLRPGGLYFCHPPRLEEVYGEAERAALAGLLAIDDEVVLTRDNWRRHRELLLDVRVLVSTWGGPVLDAEFLEAAPDLDLLLYGAGTIRNIMTDEAWERGVRVTTAADANAVPVAEFSLSQILYCLKNGWQLSRRTTAGEDALWGVDKPMAGTYGSTVGLVSLSLIGSKVAHLLQAFDVEVLAYDPVADSGRFAELGVSSVGLDELFAASDVVSVHAPLLSETRHLIDERLLRAMKRGASLINTARGAIINEADLIEVLAARPDLTAVLDVTDPEPPAPDSPLRSLPNAVITPHIAGAFRGECRRLGEAMVAELRRYLAGEPLRWEITRDAQALRA